MSIDTRSITGIVLKTSPINEFDRRVVILSKEYGKITAFARGARRQHSPLLASTQLFAFGSFQVIEGKNAYTLVSADISNYFLEIAKDPIKACYGSYFLEMASYYSRENIQEIELLKLLYQTLRILCKDSVPMALIRVIYELRMFVINGEYPECFQCVHCGKKEQLFHFSSKKSGMLCKSCASLEYDRIYTDSSVLYTMQFIITSPIERLYTFNVSESVLKTLEQIMESYIHVKIDRSFKCLEILEMMTKDFI